MSCFGTPTEVEDHQTRQLVDGETYIFKYPEKHFDPQQDQACNGWQTHWWPNCQFTYFISVTEVTAVNLRACAYNMSAEPQIKFCKKHAK
ncbi:hypothetical protein ACHAXS_000696, partial [Conticribra weissflogii]